MDTSSKDVGWDKKDLEENKACLPSGSRLNSGGSAGLEAEVQAFEGQMACAT